MDTYDINYKKMRNKIRYLIFKEQVTEVYVTEDLNVFGFKYRGIEQKDSLFFSNQDDLDLSDDELIQKYGKGKVVNLHFTDLSVASLHIPKSLFEDVSIYRDTMKHIVHRIEFEIEESEIYYLPEINLVAFEPKQLNEDVNFFIPSLNRNGTSEKLKMHHAIWYPDNF